MNLLRPGRESIIKVVAQVAPAIQKQELAVKANTREQQAPEAPEIEDKVEISDEARAKSDDFQKMLEDMRSEMRALREELKRAGEAGEGAAEAWKEKIRCLIIAMRIMSGDIVPEQDHRYLREKDMDLYCRAIMMRVEKEDPDEYDRLSEDEKRRRDDGMDGTEGAAPVVAGSRAAESNAQSAESVSHSAEPVASE